MELDYEIQQWGVQRDACIIQQPWTGTRPSRVVFDTLEFVLWVSSSRHPENCKVQIFRECPFAAM